MKLVVGLGNPGEKYEKTRHNVGFAVLDKLQTEISKQILNPNFQTQKKFNAEICKMDYLLLAKPTTFMNSSGITVKKLMVQFKVNLPDLWVIHDDLDLRLGEYKIQLGVGPKLHYGIKSIEGKLGKKDFWRVRVGVDNRSKDNRISGEAYVLQKFSEDEERSLDGVIKRLVQDLINNLTL